MKPAFVLLAGGAIAAALGQGSGHAEGGAATRRLTLTQAVDAAGTDNPEIAIAGAGIEVAGHRVDSAKALRLPRLSTDANVFLWNEAITFSLGPPPAPGAPAPEIEARGLVTSSVQLTLAQPLSGLAVISRLIAVEEHGVAVAKTQVAGARLGAQAQAAELYLRTMQAQAFTEIAQKSVAQIGAQLVQAQKLEVAGVLEKVQVMRLEAALAQAEQGVLQAKDGAAAAGDGLALILGFPAGTVLETVDDLPPEIAPPPWSEDQAMDVALAKRLDLREADLRVRQADGGADITRANFYPNVNAIATYQHTEGQGDFAKKNAFFVGIVLKWDLWDWGKTRADVDEARARAAQARLAADRARDRVRLDVRAKLRAASSRFEQLKVARRGLAAAEEAYRLASIRFAAGSDTQLGVLDAEADVTRARLALVTQRYDYAVALVQLAQAVGEAPLAALLPSSISTPAAAAPAGASR
jgi:outer membrane protein TolC